jgi:YVTN family beta-propeller protein
MGERAMSLSYAAFMLLAATGIALAGDHADRQYTLKQEINIGGEGGWDYLTFDAPSNRLFISHGTQVVVLHATSGAKLGEVKDTPGVHGIAIVNELSKGYTSNGRDNSVSVFDLKTLATLKTIKTVGGENPDFIAYDAVSKHVFTFNGRSSNASVIDAKADTLIATIALPGKPEAAVADGTGVVFVDIEDKSQMVAIDARKNTVLHTWNLPGCEEPAGLAMDRKSRRLFAACQNKTLVVINADSGKRVATLPIGGGVDAAVFDPDTLRIFTSQGDGTLTVIKENSANRFSVQQTAKTQRGARTMAFNSVSHDIYLTTAQFDELPLEPGQKRARRVMKPNTFSLLVMSEK